MPKSLLAVLLVLSSYIASGQIIIKGTVYDRSQRFAMPGVSVMGTSGAGTVTDSLGHYSIRLPARDSIFFSYLGKATGKYPVKMIEPDQPFDMSLQVDADTMPAILVWSKNYRQDSLETRKEYQQVFGYGKNMVDDIKGNKKGSGIGVGLDFDLLLNPGANRRMLAFQKRLEDEEKDKYVNHRFTRALVKKITGLEPPALDTFMIEYRPNYEFLQSFETDYEYYQFIAESAKYFSENWKKEHSN